ncbi:MAG: hypothetical protein C4325_14390 [Blastocatellia bacterium]
MESTKQSEFQPPPLRPAPDGKPDPLSIADVVAWFLAFDERTARIRHPHTDELFHWKQADDERNGVGIFPFENAEARFAVGVVQAVLENDSAPLLDLWLNDLIAALAHARENRLQITETNSLEKAAGLSPLQKAEMLTTNAEKRLYLTSCWLEALCMAEARVLGWIYLQLYGRPFTPKQ